MKTPGRGFTQGLSLVLLGFLFFAAAPPMPPPSPGRNGLNDNVKQLLETKGFQVWSEVPFIDEGERYRFDLVATDGKDEWYIEVKPEVTAQDLGRMNGSVLMIGKRRPQAWVVIATPYANLDSLRRGAVGEQLRGLMKGNRLAVLLVKDRSFVFAGTYEALKKLD